MKDKVFVDNKGILNWIPENDPGDTSGTKIAVDLMNQLLGENGGMSVLVDLSKAHRPNSDQRQIIINALRNNYHSIKKIAMFGESPLIKVVAHFIINSAGYSNMKFFSNRTTAEQWLLSDEK